MSDESAFDVVIVGAGAAGMFAAIEAAELGAEVLILESQKEIGGSTRLSGGYVALCETEMQSGSKEELLADLAESHHFDANEALSQTYVNNAPDTYVRMKELGIHFVRTETFAHMQKPWAHELPTGELGGGAQIAARLIAAAEARGVQVWLNSRASRLAVDARGRVNGVFIESHVKSSPILARRGVVIASGGFTRNLELVKTFGRPGSEHIRPITGLGSNGDGLLMAMGIGAGLAYIGVGVAPTVPMDPITGKSCLVNYAGGILLNLDGKRFVNESIVYLDISWAGLLQASGIMLQVYDSRIRDAYQGSMLGQVIFGGTEYEADDLAELFAAVARDYPLDIQMALESVSTYNAQVERGVDPDFGREHPLGKGGIGSASGDLVRIDSGPFYTAPTVAGTTHFNGGLKVDARMQVIDVFESPISGLFAAGEVTGGFHGAGYLSASLIGGALVFGRIAGKSVVEESL